MLVACRLWDNCGRHPCQRTGDAISTKCDMGPCSRVNVDVCLSPAQPFNPRAVAHPAPADPHTPMHTAQ